MEITIKRDGLTLRGILEMPEGAVNCPVVIMLHGFTANIGYDDNDILCMISNMLNRAGLATVRVDFNGHGKSDGNFSDMNVLNEIGDAIAVMEYVRKLDFVSEIYILGHSQGGVVGGMLAGYYADVAKKLVLLAPAATLKTDAQQGVCFGKKYDTDHIPEFVEIDENHSVGGHYFRIAKYLPIYEVTMHFTNPVLVVHGLCDSAVHYSASKKYKAVLADCRLKLYEHLDHGLDGADRDEMLNEIISFLTG